MALTITNTGNKMAGDHITSLKNNQKKEEWQGKY